MGTSAVKLFLLCGTIRLNHSKVRLTSKAAWPTFVRNGVIVHVEAMLHPALDIVLQLSDVAACHIVISSHTYTHTHAGNYTHGHFKSLWNAQTLLPLRKQNFLAFLRTLFGCTWVLSLKTLANLFVLSSHASTQVHFSRREDKITARFRGSFRGSSHTLIRMPCGYRTQYSSVRTIRSPYVLERSSAA